MNVLEQMNEQEKERLEHEVLMRADEFWIKQFGRQEASNVDKVRYFRNNGMPVSPFPEIITEFFKKQGFWSDGRTTLAQREKNLILQKKEKALTRKKILESKASNLREIATKALQKEKELRSIPQRLISEFKIDRQKLEENLKSELNGFLQDANEYISKEVDSILEDIFTEVKQKTHDKITKTKKEIEHLKASLDQRLKHEIDSYTTELEAELAILEYKQQDDQLIQTIDGDIRTINQELHDITITLAHKDTSKKEKKEKKGKKESKKESSKEKQEGDEASKENTKVPCPFCGKKYQESGGGYPLARHLSVCPQNPINALKDQDEQETKKKEEIMLASPEKLNKALSDELEDGFLDEDSEE